MLSILLLGANLALVAVCAFFFIKTYRAATGTVWQRVLTATHDSATMLWSYFLLAATDILSWSEKAADAVNLPEVQTWLQTNVQPKYLATVLGVVAVVNIAARLRGLMKSWNEAAAS